MKKALSPLVALLCAIGTLHSVEQQTPQATPMAFEDRGILEITSLNFKEVISQSKQVIIDVYSNRCVYCKRLEPIIQELSGELGAEYIFAKLSLDNEPALVDSFNVRGFPTIIFLKEGQEVGRHVGYMTKEAFSSEIKNFFSSK